MNVIQIPVPYPAGPIVLISCPFSGTMPWAFVYLAGYLKKRQEPFVVIERPANYEDRSFIQKILSLNPLLVGFGSLYPDLYSTQKVIQLLNKAGRSFPVVIGGQMVTPTPEFAVRITGAEMGIIGEGEITLFALARALRTGGNIAEISGLVIQHQGTVRNTGPGEQIDDLSNLPQPAFDIYPKDKWLHIGKMYAGSGQPHWRYRDTVISAHGSRGCPHRCNFCYLHSKVRYRNVDEMISEAAFYAAKYKANMIRIADELVLNTPTRARQLVAAIRREFKTPVQYHVSSRFDILSKIDDQLLHELHASGLRNMAMGIESGSQRILDVMQKGITVDQIRTGLSRLHTAKILPSGAVQVGQYGETVEDAEMTVKLIKDIVSENPNLELGFAYTTPFPGSPLYEQLLKSGVLKNDEDFYTRYFLNQTENQQNGLRLVVNISAMDDSTVHAMYKKMQSIYKMYKRRKLGLQVCLLNDFANLIARVNWHACRRLRLDPYAISSTPSISERLYRMMYDVAIIAVEGTTLRLRKII